MNIKKTSQAVEISSSDGKCINFARLNNPMFGDVLLVSLESNKRRHVVLVSPDHSFLNCVMRSDISPKITSEKLSIFALR